MRATLLSCVIFICSCIPLAVASQGSPAIDKVLVIKSERELHLMQRGEIVKSYKVSLGKKDGPKRYEGDLRTPEGIYWLDWRSPSKRYNLAINISYPNQEDRQRANELGKSPGSMIMLHGTPKDDEYPEWFFNTLNWTEGCIALTNDDMQEVWSLVKDNTLIEIRP